MADEDLEALAKLSAKAPKVLFAPSSKDRMDRGVPIEELRVKDAAFAFDAGRSWAEAAGEKAASAGCQKKLREHLEPLLSSGLDVRRSGLAFACGAMQAASFPESMKDWLFRRAKARRAGPSFDKSATASSNAPLPGHVPMLPSLPQR